MKQSREAGIHTYEEAKRWLASFAISQRKKRADPPGFERIRTLLKTLGDPQQQFRVIHLAGTSGKGSTAQVISSLLQRLGWRVGLHISPHMFDVRERMQVNHQLMSEDCFVKRCQELQPIVHELEGSSVGAPTYFELLVAMSYLSFARERIDVAVIETGMGGRFDATNTIDREDKITVITKIGFDHTAILGRTLRKIAGEKTGIIHRHNRVFSMRQHLVVRDVIRQECHAQESEVSFLEREDARRIRATPQGTRFDFYGSGVVLRDLKTNLIGRHQAENVALALRVTEEARRREGKDFDEQLVRSALADVRVPGRFEIRSIGERSVILDVAHNPQKIRSVLRTLVDLWPKQKATFIVAFGPSSDHVTMLELITKQADRIILADFCVQGSEYSFRFTDPEPLQRIVTSRGFSKCHIVRDDPEGTVAQALAQGEGPIVVTGYFHFVAAMEKILFRQ